MTLRTVKLFAQLHVSALDEQPSLVYMLPTIHILRTLLPHPIPIYHSNAWESVNLAVMCTDCHCVSNKISHK